MNGRKVRCAHCDTLWTPPEAMFIEPERPSAPEPPERPELPEPEPPPAPAPHPPFLAPPSSAPVGGRRTGRAVRAAPPRWVLIAAWVTTLVLIAAIIAVVLIQREAVMHAWPSSTRLYDAIGAH